MIYPTPSMGTIVDLPRFGIHVGKYIYNRTMDDMGIYTIMMWMILELLEVMFFLFSIMNKSPLEQRKNPGCEGYIGDYTA